MIPKETFEGYKDELEKKDRIILFLSNANDTMYARWQHASSAAFQIAEKYRSLVR